MMIVNIPKAKLTRAGHNVSAGIEIVNTLRAAGVPVIGSIAIVGVIGGSLTMQTLVDGSLNFSYEAEADDDQL